MKANKYIISALAVAIAAVMASCDENSWNNHLDGFEEANDQPIANEQTVEYTLTAANYGSIASNSINKSMAAAEGPEAEAALAKIATSHAFATADDAHKYLPAFLASTDFPYFTLTNGSAVKLEYNQIGELPQVVTEATGAQKFTVAKDYYINEVWGSDTEYIEAFAPSHPASEYLPSFLIDNADANDGLYAVVQYKNALQEPVFGNAGSAEPQPEEVYNFTFLESFDGYTIEDITLPAELDHVWEQSAIYGAKASAYKDGVSYPTESLLISPVIDLSAYGDLTMTFEHVTNKFPDLDFIKANCTLLCREQGGSWAKVEIPEYSDNASWTYVPSGAIDLNAYAGKKIQLAFKYVSEDGKSGTWEIKNLVIIGTPASRAAASYIPTETLNDVYYYNGSAWAVPSDMIVLQPDDYTAMGQSHPNLSKADPYIPTYLKAKFPYAAEGAVKNVLWVHFIAAGDTPYECTQYTYDGAQWNAVAASRPVSEQYVLNAGKWMYNPNVTITLPSGKNQELSTKYFQACVDWVYENICVPLGDSSIKSGKFYVSSYGNNEYYSGTSAYQGNVDLRPDKAREQYPAGYEGMTDEQIVALEKERFMKEVMPGALAKLHPDAAPIPGIDLLYTINFSVYTGTTSSHTAIFKVTSPGVFEPVSCTWDETAE